MIQKMKEWTREEWIVQQPDATKRRKWATELPLAWILEYQPTILLPGKGQIPLEPWAFQQEFLMCRYRFRAINKPRQCGISTIAAAQAAWEFDNVAGAQIVIISKDKDAAVNFHKYIYNILYSVRKNNPNAPKLLKTNERETTNVNGSRIVSLASSKETGRSFSATHLFFDELAFIEYADDIWQAANATLSQTKGRVTGISTPKGRANLFYQIFESIPNSRCDGCGCQYCKKHPLNKMGFQTFSYAWWDVPTYNPYYKEYKAAETAIDRKKWIEKAKTGEWYQTERPKYTDLQWRQEFEGAFDANVGTVFSTRQIEKTFVRNYLDEVIDKRSIFTYWYTSEKQNNHDYAVGIDLGRKNDPTVLVTYDYTTKPARLVDFKYIEAGSVDWEDLKREAKDHLLHWKGESKHDGTGVGDVMSDALDGYSEPFIFSKTGKQNLVEQLQHAMDSGSIRMPKIPLLYREHQRYTWDDKDLVQDTVMANALAISNFYDSENSFVGFDRTVQFVGAEA